MDWTRARLILVALLIAVNAVLSYLIWGPPGRYPPTLIAFTPAQVAEVTRRLTSMGMELSAPIPRHLPAVPLLRVRLDEATDVVKIMPPEEFSDGEREFVRLDRTAARQSAEEYLLGQGLISTNLRWERTVSNEPNLFEVEFVQLYRGLPLYGGRLTVLVSRRGVEEVRRVWLAVEGQRGQEKAVLPPTEALLRLVGHLEGRGWVRTGRTFTGIRLGYYGARPATATAWDIAPVWRIRLDNGEVYYVNAYTGDLEQ